ncbi:hypothetical protein L596_013407 [Steinernema carpocapsae]|uniref:Uncharacterized protein n=1 Tax=Steinernema carpocapsae TaxID=34508 RepID=A0A4U5P043_STECR|nr:hypothetical protein L596_013407 [Steinernema carpocapsae]
MAWCPVKKKPLCYCCNYPDCFISCLLSAYGRLRGLCAPLETCVDKRIWYTLSISEDEDGINCSRTIVWGRNDVSISKFEVPATNSIWLIPEMDRSKHIRCAQLYINSTCSEAFKYDHLEKLAASVEQAPDRLEHLEKFGITLSLAPDARVYEVIKRIISKLPQRLKRIELNFLGVDGSVLTLLDQCLSLTPKLIKMQCSDVALGAVLELMEDNYVTKLWIKVCFSSERPFTVIEQMEALQKNWQHSQQLHQNGIEVQFSAPISVWDQLPAENYLYKSNENKRFSPMYAQLRCIFEKKTVGVYGRIALYMGLEGKENKSFGFGVRARY